MLLGRLRIRSCVLRACEPVKALKTRQLFAWTLAFHSDFLRGGAAKQTHEKMPRAICVNPARIFGHQKLLSFLECHDASSMTLGHAGSFEDGRVCAACEQPIRPVGCMRKPSWGKGRGSS